MEDGDHEKVEKNGDVASEQKVHVSCDFVANQIASGVPIDKGWGWVCAIAGLVLHILFAGTLRSSGIMFVEISEQFERNNRETAAIITCVLVFLLGLSPIANSLADRWSARVIIFIGGIVVALGNFISAFATSLEFLYASYGCLVGTGFAMIHPPCVVFVAQHFHRYRTMAVGITLAGASIGSLIMPPLTRAFIDWYGLRGAFLLLAAVHLHTCVCAVLMRPISFYRRNIEIDELERVALLQANNAKTEKNHEIEDGENNVPTSKSPNIPRIQIICSKTNDEKFTQSLDQLDHSSEMPLHNDSTNSNGVGTLRKSTSEHQLTVDSETRKGLVPLVTPNTYRKKLMDRVSGPQYTMFASFGDLTMIRQPAEHDMCKTVERTEESMKNCGDCAPNVENRTFVQRIRHSFIHSMHWELWKSPVFWFYACSMGVVTEGLPMCFMILPAHAKDIDPSASYGAMVIFWMGFPDLMSRISIGWMADRLQRHSYRVFLYVFFICLEGAFWLALPVLSLSGFPGMLAFGIGVGTGGGGILCLGPVLLADLVGVQRLSSALGFSMLLEAATIIAIPSLLGYLRDTTGDWNYSIYFCGALILSGGVLVLIGYAIKRCIARNRTRDTRETLT